MARPDTKPTTESGWCCMHCGCYIGEGGKDGDNYWNNLLEAGARAGGRR